MEDSQDADLICLDPVENLIRKSANETATNVLVNALMEFWERCDTMQHFLHALREFFAEPRSLVFIPIVGPIKFGPSFTAEDYRQTHCRDLACASALTTSQGMPSLGLTSSSASRRSSSSL